MLSWIFNKQGDDRAPTSDASPAPATRPQSAIAAAELAEAKARQIEEARTEWAPRLAAAQGDDAELLRIALAAPVLETRLAAVEALVGEAALRQAERAFRDHDRKVHRLAKQRWETAVAQRETRAMAQMLIDTATALSGEALVPVNRLVTLDRAWQSLDARLLDAEQHARFAALRDQLDAALREQGELQQRSQRWNADAKRVLAELQRGLEQAAAGGSAGDAAALREAVDALRGARPDAPATLALAQALDAALQTAAQVQARLAWLAAMEQPAADLSPAPLDPAPASIHVDAADSSAVELPAMAPEPTSLAPPAPDPAQAWQGLPPVPEGELARLLNQRFEQWQRAHAPSPPSPTATAAAAAPKPPRPAAPRRPSEEQRQQLDALLVQAEGALVEGQLADMQQQLQAIDVALDAMGDVALADRWRSRHQALLAERARLKDWQKWGGGRARDDLMAEAQDLARLTLAAADPPAGAAARKLRLKDHAEAIQALRLRWKELDRLGAAASKAMWQRFDAALLTAHQPVAAQHAALKAARQENLAAREALLTTLEAGPEPAESATADERAALWKERLRALDRFQTAWRQLGPLEHTVPPGARQALQQRLRSSLERVEAPVQEARRAAEAVREQLIAQAQALLQDAGRSSPQHDAMRRVRELQAQWQQHARTLPLARAVETALWGRFKATTDALFAQREAAFHARDAELAAHLADREALLTRLSALAANATAAEIKRTLAEVDRAWRQAGDVPRHAVAGLEARLRDLHAALMQRLTDGVQQRWQTQCDALAARLSLCEAREDANAPPGDLESRWATAAALPAAWQQALAQRWARPAEPGPLAAPSVDELLLQLEAALGMPASPESQAARHQLKLRALKNALEGRAAPDLGPARPGEWLVAVMRQGGLAATQRARLQALVAALRRAPAGALGSATLES